MTLPTTNVWFANIPFGFFAVRGNPYPALEQGFDRSDNRPG